MPNIATLEAPAVETSAPETLDLISTDTLADQLEGIADNPEAAPVETKPAKVVEPKKTPEPKPEAKPKVENLDESKLDESKPAPAKEPEGIKNLRTAYDTTKKELDQTRAEKEALAAERAGDTTKLSEIEKERDELRKEREALQKERDDVRKRLTLHDPYVAKEFEELNLGLQADIEPVFETVPELPSKYDALLRQYMALPHGKPEMVEKHREFRETLKDEFPDDWQSVDSAIRRGAKWHRDRGQLTARVQEDAQTHVHTARLSEYDNRAKRFEANAEHFFEADDATKANDPYNPVAIIKELVTTDPKVADFVKKATEFARNVYLGPKPVTEKDFPGVNPSELPGRLQAMHERHEADRDTAVKMIAHGLVLTALFRPLVQELKKAQELARRSGEAEPPAPSGDGSEESTGETKIKTTDELARELQSGLG